MARSVFGDTVDCAGVRIRRRNWFPFQPRRVTMAPGGHIHFHPESPSYRDNFGAAPLALQGHFIHEMTHVWQAQRKGRWYLVLNRRPWTRYDYSIRPGWTLERYGIEQQAEIVRHAFLLRRGMRLPGVAEKSAYDLLVTFPGASLGQSG